MSVVENRLAGRLQQVADEGRRRALAPICGDLTDFCSNDYLGFAREAIKNTDKNSGSGASRLLSGTTDIMLNVESELADFYGVESAVVFSSGYQANLGLLAAVAERIDYILYDEFVHASVRDGIRLSYARSSKFEHNSARSLRDKLERVHKEVMGKVYVCVESLYSMDGDCAPLESLLAVCQEFDAALIVDEAHSSGIFGDSGEGLVVSLGLESDVFARVHTFGKAIGLHGACVAGSRVLKEVIVNFSRPFIYTTAPPDHFFVSIAGRHREVGLAADRRFKLWDLSEYFNKKAAALGITALSLDSPIKAVVYSGNERCRQAAAILQDAGFDARAVLSPTIPEGSERIRICLHCFNSTASVDALLEVLSSLKGQDE
jgi:8-amino-7-oxononanoate synthase